MAIKPPTPHVPDIPKIKLPTRTETDKPSVNDLVIFLYGKPGIGKSTFASQFKRPLFIDTQRGSKFLDVYRVDCPNWETFIGIVNALREDCDYDTIVVDVADDLFKYCREFTCAKFGILHPADDGYGKGWDMLNEEFFIGMSLLAALNKGLIFIGHDTIRDVVVNGITRSKTMPNIGKGGFNIIHKLSDMTLYAGFKTRKLPGVDDIEEDRVLITKPTDSLEALDRSGILPTAIPFSFDALKAAYEKGISNTTNLKGVKSNGKKVPSTKRQ